MKKRVPRLLAILLVLAVTIPFVLAAHAAPTVTESPGLNLNAKSAVLMEYETGQILYEQNPDEELPPASITKVMTLLLVMEALEDKRITLREPVTVSETAAAMGGSQIFLEAGEQMPLEDMLKSVVIASANDAAAALAEHISGSIEAFVESMNRRAVELGMTHTHFENTNGLDDTTVAHYTSARDVAIMSRALIAHPLILKYSSTWMDSVRGGAFGLTNTNRLIRFYPGATGLKTGSTAKAGFCISATAMRNGMHLIAVIMGAPSRDIRNDEAKKLLDYGFANYALYKQEAADVGDLPVKRGTSDACRVRHDGFSVLIPKGKGSAVRCETILPQALQAPIKRGDRIGCVSYYIGEKKIGESDIYAAEDIGTVTWAELFRRMLCYCFRNGG